MGCAWESFPEVRLVAFASATEYFIDILAGIPIYIQIPYKNPCRIKPSDFGTNYIVGPNMAASANCDNTLTHQKQIHYIHEIISFFTNYK